MFEINVLRCGNASRSGDAMMARFTRADTGAVAHMIVDAGFQDDGVRLVELFRDFYATDVVDVAIVTHPDGDHIGGMGSVVRNLRVQTLAVHRPSLHNGAGLPASRAVEDLIRVAHAHGTANFVEPFAGLSAFGGAVYIAGPSEAYYEQLIQEQLATEGRRAASAPALGRVEALAQRVAARILPTLPMEIPFDDAGGDNARNNSAAITHMRVEADTVLLTSDAGVPALNRAIDQLRADGRADRPLDYLQLPHHGSRHNMDSPTLDRLLGRPGEGRSGWAFVSITEVAARDPRYPSPRVCNGCLRRGYPVVMSDNGDLQMHSPDVPLRPGYGPAEPLPPLDESIDDR